MRLQAGEMVCDVQPQLGACIAGLWLGNEAVLRSIAPGAALDSARQSGCYPLVPFSNRIAHATLQWNGTEHPLVRNNAPEPHAIHGIGWQRNWELLESDDRFALMSFEHRSDASWPFDFDTSQSIRLSPDSAEFTLSMTNQSRTAAPAGLGWHPFFVKRPRSHIAFAATGRWEMGADKLPTHRSASTGLDAEGDSLDVDHCFDGWSGRAELRDEQFIVRVESNLRRVVVFTNPSRDTIAIEPVSHVNNALNLADREGGAHELGVTILQPGQTLTAQMTINVERVS